MQDYDGITLEYRVEAGTVVPKDIDYLGFITPNNYTEPIRIIILREFTVTCPYTGRKQVLCDLENVPHLYEFFRSIKAFPKELIKLSTKYKLKNLK